jgi:hypothetical protein
VKNGSDEVGSLDSLHQKRSNWNVKTKGFRKVAALDAARYVTAMGECKQAPASIATMIPFWEAKINKEISP